MNYMVNPIANYFAKSCLNEVRDIVLACTEPLSRKDYAALRYFGIPLPHLCAGTLGICTRCRAKTTGILSNPSIPPEVSKTIEKTKKTKKNQDVQIKA